MRSPAPTCKIMTGQNDALRLSVSVVAIDRLYSQNDSKCIAIVKPKFHTVCFLTTFIIPYCKRAASTIQSPSMIFLVLSSCGQPDWFQLAAIPIPVSICLTLSVSLPLSVLDSKVMWYCWNGWEVVVFIHPPASWTCPQARALVLGHH